jgi:hypothetical protein
MIPEPSLTPPEPKRDLWYQEKSFHCSMCFKEIPEEQSKFNLCKAHEEDAQKRFLEFMNTFSKDERGFLNWRYDGEAF